MTTTVGQSHSGPRGQRGVTLIELLVVLTILGFLTALIAINVLPELDKSAVKKAEHDISVLENALEQYRLDMMSYPTTEQGLAALMAPPAGSPRADQYRPGGYIRQSALRDPWDSDYHYRFPGEHGVFDIYSLGADKAPGGEGLNADIGNWTETN